MASESNPQINRISHEFVHSSVASNVAEMNVAEILQNAARSRLTGLSQRIKLLMQQSGLEWTLTELAQLLPSLGKASL
jgi:hypothetical protein